MDTLLISNDLLQTIQLIPIFTYMNILSDFLVAENYLAEIDQTKQIPIINALYEYFEFYHYNQYMKEKLIRSLLQGSDLYGEKLNEKFDIAFANAMFDYIISSLVFDKYGNVNGFLANVILQAENLQIDYVFQLIKNTLKNATFENEYGDRSILTSLSIYRIFNDIILPLFPQQKMNFNLMSLDYIYAQAGSIFLRSGRINTNYYNNLTNYYVENIDVNNLFNEYLIIGHIIANLLQTEKKNLTILKAFSLPALIYYIFNFKYLYINGNIRNEIFNSIFWHEVYKYFFQYQDNSFNDMEIQLNNDYTFKIHVAFFNYQNPATMAKNYMDIHCTEFNETWRILNIPTYLRYPRNFTCGTNDTLLPNIKKLFIMQINDIVKLYETYDLRLVENAFGESLIQYLNDVKVVVKLMIPYDRVNYGDFTNLKQQSYDVLEFYFPENKTHHYYALIRENYNVILINNVNNSQFFEKKIGFLETLRNETISLILKDINNNVNDLFKNFINYKKERLKSYLKFFNFRYKGNSSWKNEWWKEFAFSLIPYYPCFSKTPDGNYICPTVNNMTFLDKQNSSQIIIDTNTKSLFSSLGTTIKSIFLKFIINQSITQDSTLQKDYKLLKIEDFLLHQEEPAFELAFITQDDLYFLKKIISSLEEKINFQFYYTRKNLHKISILKSNYFRSVHQYPFEVKNRSRLILINTLNNTDTGYGYKFIILSKNSSTIAQLRTNYEQKNEIIVLPLNQHNKKIYNLLNSNLQSEPYFMYEINNHLRKKDINISFSGIAIYHDDEKCFDKHYIGNLLPLNACDRQWRLKDLNDNEEKSVMYIKNYTNLSVEMIRDKLKKYTFVDTTALWEFTNNWIHEKKEPNHNDYIVNNPDLLNNLRYNVRLENHTVSIFDGKFRINLLYTQKERLEIENGILIENLIKDYNAQKAVYSVTFDDYYAIRNYATTGYTRITSDTCEAKLMKIALYKLAIRQSDDPIGEFELKLFRIETKSHDSVNKLLKKKNITLEKFTTTSTNATSAMRFAAYPLFGFRNIVYEIIFNGRYLRAKIEQFSTYEEKMVILLPGSKFNVTNIQTLQIGGLGSVLKLKLTYQHNLMEKHIWYKNIMNEIARIEL